MPHKAAQSLAAGVSMRKKIEGVCEEIRVMMPVSDGLCMSVFLSISGDESKPTLCSLGAALRVVKGAQVVIPLGLNVVVVWAFWVRLWGCRYVG
jgi:hypothetical protein